MRLLDQDWQDGFLDETRLPGTYRLQVRLWLNVQRLDDLYFTYQRDWRRLWNYVTVFGVMATAAKVASRRTERLRNEKHLSVGIGTVLEADLGSRCPPGTPVAFVGPAHPRCAERVVLPEPLVRPLSEAWGLDVPELLYVDRPPPGAVLPVPAGLAGWSPDSGRPVEAERVVAFLAEVEKTCRQVMPSPTCTFATGSPVRERVVDEPTTSRPRAVLFGYGNYAKVVILPNVRRYLDVTEIHEIDPTQIGRVADGPAWDTSPLPRADRHHDVWIISGYHHTHAELGAQALRAGAVALIEKPLATTHQQLAELASSMDDTGGSVFAGFHRRYSPFNPMAREDLGVAAGDPISYSCIVYEVPLPANHWYKWPASRSRLTSNGCHWIDHFLYLNEFAEVRDFNVLPGPDDDVTVAVELDNGAFFSMMLTSTGSGRTGLENYVELRAGDRTVKIVNDSTYRAESNRKVLRRKRAGRLASYPHMYRTIAERVSGGGRGDTVRSLASASLVLRLEDDYQAARAARASAGRAPRGPAAMASHERVEAVPGHPVVGIPPRKGLSPRRAGSRVPAVHRDRFSATG